MRPSKAEIDAALLESEETRAETIASRKAEIIAAIFEHSKILSELKESLPFTGVDPIVYEDIKREEAEFPESAEFSTPIDELIARFKAEGMKVVLAKDPSSPNVTVVPWGSTNYDKDSLLFRHLQVYGMVDLRLKKLITSLQEYKKLADLSKAKI